ncbi:hypothetical protein AA313_de0204007 [Arthrobotrys entomopaga]|nr:hypothetical protein AA313_de0204007 [Arthrobotrys entomopaga]
MSFVECTFFFLSIPAKNNIHSVCFSNDKGLALLEQPYSVNFFSCLTGLEWSSSENSLCVIRRSPERGPRRNHHVGVNWQPKDGNSQYGRITLGPAVRLKLLNGS